MTLRAQGFRLLAKRETEQAEWIHPAEAPARIATGWTDCTDMDDEEFAAFVLGEPKTEL